MGLKRDMLKSVIKGDMAGFKTSFSGEVDARVGQACVEVKDRVQSEFGDKPQPNNGEAE